MADDDFSDILNSSAPSGPAASPAAPSADGQQAADQKVELDLDDAPFLMDDPEPAPAEETQQESEKTEEEQQEEAAAAPRPWFKHPAFIGGLGGLTLGAIALALVLILASPKPDPAPDPIIRMGGDPGIQSSGGEQPVQPADPSPQRFQVNFKPFLVFVSGQEGMRMLTFKFTVFAEDLQTNYNMMEKEIFLRNAVYDFLRAQRVEELTRPTAANELKVSLRTLLAGALPDSSVGEVLIEQILIQ